MHKLDLSTKQIFRGNLLLILCCCFYLAWWLLAFRPGGAIKGIKTGWLLLPAFAAGLTAVMLIVSGMRGAAAQRTTLLPKNRLLLGGIIAYCFLLLITRLLFKRPVTTELFLIVGWAVLAEINTLYGAGLLSLPAAAVLLVLTAAAALIGLVCYVLYYHLDLRSGYFAGMVPLLVAALVTAAISLIGRP